MKKAVLILNVYGQGFAPNSYVLPVTYAVAVAVHACFKVAENQTLTAESTYRVLCELRALSEFNDQAMNAVERIGAELATRPVLCTAYVEID